MTTVNVRIDEKTKLQANKVLSRVGFDMSSAVKVFLSQVIIEDGLPFTPTRNPKEIRARWDRQLLEAKKQGKKYKNAKQALSGM